MDDLEMLLMELETSVNPATPVQANIANRKSSGSSNPRRPSTQTSVRMSRYETPTTTARNKLSYFDDLLDDLEEDSGVHNQRTQSSKADLDDIFDLLEPAGAKGIADTRRGTLFSIDPELDAMMQGISTVKPVSTNTAFSAPPREPPVSHVTHNNTGNSRLSSHESWTVDQVGVWLKTLDVNQVIIDAFIENEVDGSTLGELTKEDLKDDLGITALGPRTKLFKAIKELTDGGNYSNNRISGGGSPMDTSSFMAQFKNSDEVQISENNIPIDEHVDSYSRSSNSHTSGNKDSQLPICAGCKFPISSGKHLMCAGKDWHEQCFSCAICSTKLTPNSFFEFQGNPYCETHFIEVSSVRCGYCNGYIEGECIIAMDKNWHVDHFFCSHCGASIADDFSEHEGLGYCGNCYKDLYAAKCMACSLPITDTVLSITEGTFHEKCFKCTKCQENVAGQYWLYKGKLYCKKHAAEAKGEICYDCKQTINGKSIRANDKAFHVDHFHCRYCKKNLVKDTKFQVKFDQFYCLPCYVKLYE